VNGIKKHRSADHEWACRCRRIFFQQGRQSRPCDRADRLGDPMRSARSCRRGSSLRSSCNSMPPGVPVPADQPELRPAQRAAAFTIYGIYRMRQQPGPDPRHHPADARRRGSTAQIMVDLDPSKLLAKGLTPLGRRERCQCAKSDRGRRAPRRSTTGNTPFAPMRRLRASTSSTIFRSRSRTAPPSS